MEDFNRMAKFYICEHCGNLVTTIHNAGVPLVCCGEKMKELLPNTVEASGEKHLPVAEHSGSTLTVTVGAVEHPMVDVHHIQWLFVETENGGQLRYLAPGQAPKAVFELGGENHNNGGGGGDGSGCLIAIAVVVVLVLIAMGS